MKYKRQTQIALMKAQDDRELEEIQRKIELFKEEIDSLAKRTEHNLSQIERKDRR